MNHEFRDRALVRRQLILKRVVKGLPNALLHSLLTVDRQRVIQVELKNPHVIKTDDVIRMFVRVQHSVHDPKPLSQELEPQIRSSVDQQIPARKTQNTGTACAFVPWVLALANLAATPDRGHPDGSPGTEENEFSLNVLGDGYGHNFCSV
jgi:hypothetical protein